MMLMRVMLVTSLVLSCVVSCVLSKQSPKKWAAIDYEALDRMLSKDDNFNEARSQNRLGSDEVLLMTSLIKRSNRKEAQDLVATARGQIAELYKRDIGSFANIIIIDYEDTKTFRAKVGVRFEGDPCPKIAVIVWDKKGGGRNLIHIRDALLETSIF